MTISGALLNTPYTNGTESYAIGVSGNDAKDGLAVAGVAEVALERDASAPGASAAVACSNDSAGRRQCAAASPMSEFAVDTAPLQEGQHTLRATATDDAQNKGRSDVVNFYVDRTPPPPAGDFDAAYEASTGDTTVTWSPPEDPPLRDGAAPSGTTSYSFRYKRNIGNWTDWTLADQPWFDVSGSHLGEAVDVEVRAIDAVGNVGTSVSMSLTATDPFVTPDSMAEADPVPGEGTATVNAGPAEEDEVVAAASYEETPCGADRRCGAYNGRAAARYALRWSLAEFKNDRDASQARNRAYDYFGGNGGDCANFVSQALYAGGMRFQRSHGVQSRDAGDPDLRSKFIRGAGSFWSYYFDVPTLGAPCPSCPRAYNQTHSFIRTRTSFERLRNYAGAELVARDSRLQVGDVVYYSLNGTTFAGINHVQIVSRRVRGRAYVTQHSPGYTKSFRTVLNGVNEKYGTRGTDWQYWVVRPGYTGYNLP